MSNESIININDLPIEMLCRICDLIDTPKEWKSIGHVSKWWREISNELKEKKARQFMKPEITNDVRNVLLGCEDENGVIAENFWCQRSISKSYFYLPNHRLHGTHTTTNILQKRGTQEIIEKRKTIKKFKWGSQVSEESVKLQ